MSEPVVGDIVHYYPDEKDEKRLAVSRRLRGGGPFAALVVDVQLVLVTASRLHRVLTLRVFAHEPRRDRLVRNAQGSSRPYPGFWTPRETRDE